MGADFKVNGVAGVEPLGYSNYPVAGSLRDLFLLGTDLSSSTDNQVDGRSNATATGASITYNDGFVSFAGAPASNNYSMGSNENEFASWSRIAMFRFDSAIGPSTPDWRGVMGSYSVSTSRAMMWGHVATLGTSGGLRTLTLGLPSPPHSKFQFSALTYDAATKTMRTVYGRGGKLFAADLRVDANGWVGGAVPILIGGHGGSFGANNSTVSINSIAQHNAALTDVELLAIYIYLRSRAVDDFALNCA